MSLARLFLWVVFASTVMKLTPHKQYLFNADYSADSLHPNINMHIFHIILYTLPLVLKKKNRLTITMTKLTGNYLL